MPGRNIPLVTGQIYHVVNRGIASQPIFLGKRDYDRALDAIFYYQNQHVPSRYSYFLRLPLKQRTEILTKLRQKREYLVEIVCFCLMPNHIHILLKQLQANGISNFMSNITNSFTRYFNTKNHRLGHLFQGKFKAVRIETEEQLIHVSRYIHLNPYTSYLLKGLEDLEKYPYSSMIEYMNPKGVEICNKEIITSQFKSRSNYRKFIFDQADYQRQIGDIKHLILEV